MDVRGTASQFSGTPAEDVLLAVMKAGGESGRGAVREAASVDDGDLVDIVQELRSLGLVREDPSMAGEIELTSRGKQVAEEAARSRTSGPARADAVRRGILAWLADNPYAGTTEEFVGTAEATAYDLPFTATEVSRQTDYLHSKGLISGTGAMGEMGAVLLRPEVTPEGDAALISGTPIEVYVRGGGSYYDQSNTTSFGGDNYGGVQTGSGNVQHVTVNLSREERTEVEREVDALLDRLDQEDDGSVETVREALVAVRTEARAETATPSTLRDKMAIAMSAALTSESTTFVVSSLGQLVSNLTNTV